jgi:hypothetical protein
MAEIRKLPIDAANDLDIIMLYILQIFLLQDLRVADHFLVEFSIGS